MGDTHCDATWLLMSAVGRGCMMEKNPPGPATKFRKETSKKFGGVEFCVDWSLSRDQSQQSPKRLVGFSRDTPTRNAYLRYRPVT